MQAEKEILEKLIDWYEGAIYSYKEDLNYDVLIALDVTFGVCNCAKDVFGVEVEFFDFVAAYNYSYTQMWCPPLHPWNLPEVNIDLLNNRLNKMKTYYEKNYK